MNVPEYCRSREGGRLHRYGEKDCLKCKPVTKTAPLKPLVSQGR